MITGLVEPDYPILAQWIPQDYDDPGLVLIVEFHSAHEGVTVYRRDPEHPFAVDGGIMPDGPDIVNDWVNVTDDSCWKIISFLPSMQEVDDHD